MAKPKISRPVLCLALAATCVIAYLVATAPQQVVRNTRARPTVHVDVTSGPFTPDDYKASFPGFVAVSRNSFKPLVVRKNTTLISALAAAGGVPTDFTGGDGNWVCTGVAEVDGVRQALLENRSSGEGVFLRQGDRWKKTVVSQVMEDAVVLVGPGGQPRTIHVQQDEAVEETPTEVVPVQPKLSGPIGGGQPNATNGQATQVPPLPFPTAPSTDE